MAYLKLFSFLSKNPSKTFGASDLEEFLKVFFDEKRPSKLFQNKLDGARVYIMAHKNWEGSLRREREAVIF